MSWAGKDGLARHFCRLCGRLNVGVECLGPCRCEVHAAHAQRRASGPCPCETCSEERTSRWFAVALVVALVAAFALLELLR